MNRLKLEHNKRSKSLDFLNTLHNCSNESVKTFHKEIPRKEYKRIDSPDINAEEDDLLVLTDSSIEGSSRSNEYLHTLEQKIEKLSDYLVDQEKILTDIKTELKLNNSFYNLSLAGISTELAEKGATEDFNTPDDSDDRAKNLLCALKPKDMQRLEREIKEVLSKFLQSDDLKEQLVLATQQCVQDAIRSSLSDSLSAHYLPTLERSQRHLLNHVTNVIRESFRELEDNTKLLSISVHRRTKTLRRTLQEHQSLLDKADSNLLRDLKRGLQEILHEELRLWRENLFDVLFTQSRVQHVSNEDDVSSTTSSFVPSSPPQPADPKKSIIDQLLKSAEIHNLMRAGEENSSFERALSAADLTLVVAACRAAEPARLFAPPCRLRQPVLLSLVQQLATDMVHDTQLKCRYLEDALINLNPCDAVTRSHLPIVVKEVREHLTKFLTDYPNHVASRRVALIIMAANNLLS
ncbi:enhancer of mRNA-decapping protein 4 [Papilio machaon]|uniref:enhancer of mRNA-decapping protein 4 n=1 Tax=Papilio machaon TaxID=76193 RepID=UPI001E662B4C|nr:enhancer of mRNA-decapping protein 4 [Papilio machaon]